MNITTKAGQAHSLRRVIIVHGYAAHPDAHWFPWLSDSLHREGVDATVVALPTPDDPETAAWESAVTDTIAVPDEGTWIVAHSLGGITVLRALAALTQPWQLGGLVLVSGFTGQLASLPVLDTYLATDVDSGRVAKSIGVRVMVRSDADAFVPPGASDELARRLDAEVYVQPGAGHFLAEDGVTSLPLLLNLLHG
ncbi:serine hydrolase family protein [Arthrobacter sp. CDRTa11]|uniref:RBBP9/YdeN family alpha/beta hydrolase n=1 Tax=Arthrobacter sp. CDRTa11 TaxID=2651199 RepID=UPI0022658C96|nr:alpha/beta hydrolase [Arthrobacter sp. CDRTa11]UZX02122.1 serine hydrolase family protein [Arthrobacter sp. CDRTa11]